MMNERNKNIRILILMIRILEIKKSKLKKQFLNFDFEENNMYK